MGEEEQSKAKKQAKQFYEMFLKRNNLDSDGKEKTKISGGREGKKKEEEKDEKVQTSKNSRHHSITTDNIHKLIHEQKNIDDGDDDVEAEDLSNIPKLEEVAGQSVCMKSEIKEVTKMTKQLDLEDVE